VTSFDLLVASVSVAAGAIASLAGFGIGSLLTPLIAFSSGTKVAVALVSIPHAVGTAIRFWRLRSFVDWRVMRQFGLASAAGGFAGAFSYRAAPGRALSVLFGALLLFVAVAEFTGFMRRVRFGRGAAYAAGAVSGFFGGMVGNQGGIRAAGLLAFDIRKEAFVATATSIALLVDAARMPVYFVSEWPEIAVRWPLVILATLGVVAGTLAGERLLGWMPQTAFRRTVAAIIGLLGASFLWRSLH
jgi:uncharacterized membrane protein YfcA